MLKKNHVILALFLLVYQFSRAQTPPIAQDDNYFTETNTTLNVGAPGILENDTDVDDDSLLIILFALNGTVYSVGETASFAEGTITINANGSFRFNPTTNFTGNIPFITYSITDGVFTDSANLNIKVSTPPNAEDDEYTTVTNTTLNINAPGILINDLDEDTLTVVSFVINGTTYSSGETASFTQGSITLNANGSFIFVPADGFKGTVPRIRYIVSDGNYTDFAYLNITVLEAPPIALNDYYTADINTTLSISNPGILSNDTDAENDPLRVINFSVNGTVYRVGQRASFAQGSITLNANGSFTFVPTTDYFGDVPPISYTISDGTFRASATLFLTVERLNNLLEIESFSSCNQGYTKNGEYKIEYGITLKNKSTARDYHPGSLIKNIDLTTDLKAVFGNNCVLDVQNVIISTGVVTDFIDAPYPREFTSAVINSDFVNSTSTSMFNSNAVNNLTLYPRQTIDIRFCVIIDPFCNGRPNPTPSGAGINFRNILNVTSSIGNDLTSLLLKDFHSTEAVVAAGLYVPGNGSTLNSNGTYQFTNTIVITNEGTNTANNINYNMGLGVFLNNGIAFKELKISQIQGATVSVNDLYDGDTNTLLLAPNNSISPGETIILEVFSITEVIPTSRAFRIDYPQIEISQSQGSIDDFNESSTENKRLYSYVTWSDGLGNHLDKYYKINTPTQTASSASECICYTSNILFRESSSKPTSSKTISSIEEKPNGILEHEEFVFEIEITNDSDILELRDLQLQDDLSINFKDKIVSVFKPIIVKSTATIDPQLNNSYNGTSDINIFNGTSGLLLPTESITVHLKVIFNEAALGINTANFSAINPYNILLFSPPASINVDASSDTDIDGITNLNDIDDDNDTIPDIVEYNGLDPLDDDDDDLTPNYRDTDFGIDANNDGIVDIFDFDNDGVPNHLDLDSDNDGILDIIEVGSINSNLIINGRTTNNVGINGLDDTIENIDTFSASIIYTIPNTDIDNLNNPNFLDIDSDGDGIVDIIEAQTTENYIPPKETVSLSGIDDAYPNGIDPIDTDGDGIFDYIDTNSDNDIRDDIIEGWDFNNDGIADKTPSNNDDDRDGLDNAYDTNNSLRISTNNQIPVDFPNEDNPDTNERDWREIIEIVLIINNVEAIEGVNLEFTISLVTRNSNSIFLQSTTPITIDFLTSDGTDTSSLYNIAIAPYDYNEIMPNAIITNTLIIPPFTETANFIVTSLEDTINELDELFTLNGTITSNNTVNTQITGVGTILDNDDLPSITMNNSRANEGNDLEHIVVLSHPSSRPTQIQVNTSDGEAINPEDYITVSTNLMINGTFDPANPNLDTFFAITTIEDNLNEPDEESLNVIGSVTSTNIGVQDLTKTGTIIDIDPDPLLVIDDITAVEGLPLVFTISLLNPDSGLPMLNYLPINFNLESLGETATIIQDFQMLNINSSIPAFTFSTTQSVETVDDELNEITETMLLQANITSTGVSNSSAFGTGTIKDNDFPNLFSPNSDGESDVFRIDGIEDFPNFILIIFDRWGSEVYNYKNNGSSFPIWWDGTNNGKPVIEGVYFYRLNFNDGTTPPRTNFIQLIR